MQLVVCTLTKDECTKHGINLSKCSTKQLGGTKVSSLKAARCVMGVAAFVRHPSILTAEMPQGVCRAPARVQGSPDGMTVRHSTAFGCTLTCGRAQSSCAIAYFRILQALFGTFSFNM